MAKFNKSLGSTTAEVKQAETLSANNVEVLAPVQEVPQEEQKVSLTLEEIKILVDRKLQERDLKNQTQALEDVPKTESRQDTTTIKNENFDEIPELRNWEAKERIYVLVDGRKPISQEIRARHKAGSPLQYLNKEKNEQFSLFYSLTQTSFFKELHKGDSVVTHIFMKEGMLKTTREEVKLQKFLAIHPDNVANGGSIFEEYNPSKEAEVKIEQEDLLIDAQILNRDLKFTQKNAVARLMCPDYKDTWEPAELKWALGNALKKDPAKFIKLANDKTLEIKGIAKTAVEQGLLIYRNRKFFNDKEEFICELMAKDQDEWAVIANHLLSAQGNNLYDFLKHAIN